MSDALPNLTAHTNSPPSRRASYTSRIAAKAVRGVIEPFPGYPDVPFDESFDWAHEEPGLVQTYQLYLHNLKVVNELLHEYWETKSLEYAEQAKRIVFSWLDYIDSGNTTPMTWTDHGIAGRARVLIYLAYTCQQAGVAFDQGRLAAAIRRHAELLMSDEKHGMNNHGIMMDHALICCGFVLDNLVYVLKGMWRVEAIFWQTYSHRGVHQENSPEYHRMVTGMFWMLEEYLKGNGQTLGGDVLSALRQADDYLGVLARPNGTLPQFGDTTNESTRAQEIRWGAFHDELSGATIIKNRENRSYIGFICGMSSRAHKHSDDLSITLSSRGVDFLVDAGKYNYGNNKYRRYLTSNKAHSSLSLGRTYIRPTDNKLTRKVATDHFLDAGLFTVVSGYVSTYEDAFLRRTVYSIPAEEIVLIRDEGVTLREDEMWCQRFNLHSGVSVEEVRDGEFLLTRSGVSIRLRSDKRMIAEVREGDVKSRWPRAVNSPQGGKIVPTNQIVASAQGVEQLDSITVISLSGDERKVEADATSGMLRVQIDDREYPLPDFDLYPSEMFAPRWWIDQS